MAFALLKLLNSAYKYEPLLFLHNPNIVLASSCECFLGFFCVFLVFFWVVPKNISLTAFLPHPSVTPTAYLSLSLHLPLCRLTKAVFHQPFHPPHCSASDRSLCFPLLSVSPWFIFSLGKSQFSGDSGLQKAIYIYIYKTEQMDDLQRRRRDR